MLDIAKLFKYYFFCLLVFLPFQKTMGIFAGSESIGASVLKIFSYVDEISIVFMTMLLVVFALHKSRAYGLHRYANVGIFKYLAAFLLICLLSLRMNQVPLLQGIMGIFDFFKNILVIYLVAALHWERDELLRLVGILKVVGIVLGVSGLVGEVLALAFHLGIGQLTSSEMRFGFYRVLSVAGPGQANYLGLYLILVFFLVLVVSKNGWGKVFSLSVLAGTILLGFSRQTLSILAILLMVRNRKLALLAIPLVLAAVILVKATGETYGKETYFRGFTYYESLEILKKNPVLGVGPGMFGGVVSIMFDSPVYSEWPPFFKWYLEETGSIDAFWPSLWGETGIAGLVAFVSFLLAILFRVRRATAFYRSRDDKVLCSIGEVLGSYMIAIVLMCFFCGLNAPNIVFTYFGMLGMFISVYRGDMNRSAKTSASLPPLAVQEISG